MKRRLFASAPLFALVLALAVAGPAAVVRAQTIEVGNFVDFSSDSLAAGKEYGQGKIDAVEYINRHGGIGGRRIDLLTIDYRQSVEEARAAYERWVSKYEVVAVLGWLDGDAEALAAAAARDELPYFGASYLASLTDPGGRSAAGTPSPYNFFYGPSSSDGVRALLQWAAGDWARRDPAPGRPPRYLHMGADRPYPEAPRKAGEDYARELGFQVLPAIRYGMQATDFAGPCADLKRAGADYVFLANTSASNGALLLSCAAAGVEPQFMTNVWGYDEYVMKAAGEAADGLVWVMGAAEWGRRVPGMALVEEISRISDPKLKKHRAVHYLRGICSAYAMKEALDWAERNGGITGPQIKAAMYERRDWVPQGLEGVCPPASWTAEDHRAVVDIALYRGRARGGEGTIAELIAKGRLGMERIFTARIPRKPDWLGW